MATSKVVFGGQVLMDLTADTVEPDKLLAGVKAHGADGEPIIGTCDYDSNTQDATVLASEMLETRVGYNKGNRVVGTMKNNGAVEGTISQKEGKFTVPQGYHDGSGTVALDPVEMAKLIPANIRDGITILGVEGDMSGMEDAKPQAKSVTPSLREQVVLPDAGYNYLSQVTVAAIPYTESDNSAGGKTVTIG